MPAVTPQRGYPYQTVSDSPAGHLLGEDLALAVDGDMAARVAESFALDARLDAVEQAQLTAETIISSGNISQVAGSNVVIASVTFAAVSGRRYELHYDSSYRFDTGNLAILSIRHASGGSITTGSPSVGDREVMALSTALHTPVSMSRTFTPSAGGTYTAGVTCNFYNGAGNLIHAANGNSQMYLRVRGLVV